MYLCYNAFRKNICYYILTRMSNLNKKISLNGTWSLYYWNDKIRNSDSKLPQGKKIEAIVPGNVEIDLLNNGIINDDLFKGMSTDENRWIEDFDWWYEREFVIKTDFKRAFLSFGAVDCIAEYYLNGEKVFESNNAFTEIKFEITDKVILNSKNIIAVHIKYSKYTDAGFENYRVAEGYNNVEIALSDLNNGFTVYRNRNTGKSGFDVQNSAAENPYVTGKAQAWANDAVFFNKDTSSNFRVTTKVSNMTLSKDGAAGIAFTSDETLYYVGVSDYSGTVVLRLAGTTLGDNTLKTVKSENTDIQKSGEYTITVERIGASLKAYLNNADTPQISLDLTTQTIYPLSSANVKSKVGFYVETGTTATFSKYDYQILSDVANKGYTKTIVNNANDFYAETTVKTVKCSTSVWPCAGLRIYNGTNHIDFVALYNQSETPSFSRAYIGYLETGSSEVQENINLSTITDKLNNGTGVKFAVAKLNGVIYFFIDNVLIAKREYPA